MNNVDDVSKKFSHVKDNNDFSLKLYELYKETNIYKKYIKYVNNKKKTQNIMSIPVIDKIVINSTTGKVLKNKDILIEIFKSLYIITLQKPILLKAKKSEDKFRVMKGNKIGYKVTLRSFRKYFFLEKLLSFSFFKITNFNGLKESSFNFSNYAFGIDDFLIFPEISAEKLKYRFGFDVMIVIKRSNKKDSLELLKFLGFPILM